MVTTYLIVKVVPFSCEKENSSKHTISSRNKHKTRMPMAKFMLCNEICFYSP